MKPKTFNKEKHQNEYIYQKTKNEPSQKRLTKTIIKMITSIKKIKTNNVQNGSQNKHQNESIYQK
jgi:hypothetical protein